MIGATIAVGGTVQGKSMWWTVAMSKALSLERVVPDILRAGCQAQGRVKHMFGNAANDTEYSQFGSGFVATEVQMC